MPQTRTNEHHSILGRLTPEDIQELMASKGTIMVFLDPSGDILDISPSGCELLGYTKSELVGKNWFVTIVPSSVSEKLVDSYDIMLERREGCVSDKYNPKQYNPVLTKDGEIRLITWRTKIITDSDETVVGSVSYGYDITEIREIETTLRATEQELSLKNMISEAFLKISDDDIYSKVLDILLEATGSEFGIFGYIREDGAMVSTSMSSESCDQCTLPEKDLIFPPKKWTGVWGEVMRERKSRIKNEPNTVPGGHVPISRSLIVPLIHSDSLIGVIIVANKQSAYIEDDLNLMGSLAESIAPILHTRLERDRQRAAREVAEKELRTSEQRYKELYSKAPAGLVRSKVESGKIVECNEKLALMLGYASREEYIATSTAFDAYVNPEDRHRFAEIIQSDGEAHDYEVLLKRRDGSTFWALMNAHIVPDSDIIETVVIDISVEKSAKDLIAYQRDFFKAVIDSLALPFYVIKTDDFCLGVTNKVANPDNSEDLHCYQILGETIPCFERGFACPMEKVSETRNPVTVIQERVDADGLLKVLEIHGHPIISDNGDIKRMIEYVVDATERHQREILFRIQKDLGFVLSSGIALSSGFDEILEAVLQIPGVDYSMLHLPTENNQFMLQAHRGVPDKLLSQVEILGPDMTKLISKKEPCYTELLDGRSDIHSSLGIQASCIIPLLHDDEVIASLTLASTMLRMFSDAIKNTLESLATMISGFIARAQAESALRESEERYRSLFESSRDGIAITDLEGYVVDANSSFLAMTGYTLEELQSIPYDEFTPARWRNMENAIVQNQVMRRGYSDPYEKEYICKDGTIIPIRIRVWLVLDENDEPIRMLAIVRNITEEIKIAEERALQNRELELYASLLHHDLGNDLQVLMTSIQALQMLEITESESITCMMDSAKASAERMGHLLKILGRPVDVENRIVTLLEDVAENAQEVHPGMKVKVTFGKGARDLRVFGSRLLPTVFENLLRNSAQHAGEHASVEITITRIGDLVEIQLTDDGPGVPSELIPRLFQKGVSSNDGGFGLYLARQVLAVYDGSIEYVASDIGATFLITLKIAQ
ncbi:MAG: putative Histidine kinase [Candidatus Thorarchaeota archaeon]|nr:MAG: putative Histidine kinase [Candidatus Thorarchaeota archaeon]